MKRFAANSHIFIYYCLIMAWPGWGGCPMMEAQTCLPAGITFSSQAALDAFPSDYPGCTMILGSVLIEESVAGDIRNLTGLSALISIGEHLEISGNNGLQSLAGLDHLLEVGESLSISGNQALLNIEALERLSYVGQSLRISANGALKDVEGLQSISRIFQDVSISNNAALRNLAGLDSLVSIEGQLRILSNPSLTNLVGLSSLTRVGDIFEIFDNPLLQSVSALGQLQRVGGDLIFDSNQALWSLRGLEGLQEVGEFLQMANNASLSSLNGLQGLRQIGGLLQVYNNFALTNLAGLDSIDYQSIKHLALLSSANLTHCSVKSICDYLKDPVSYASINGNESGCNTRLQILAACEGEGLNSQPRQLSGLVLFPNPTSGMVTIKGREIEGATVSVFDISGKKAWQGKVQEQSFQLGIIPAGFYLVHIWHEQNFYSRPLLKID